MKKKDNFNFYNGGKPCKPIKIRRLSQEEGEMMMERLAELRREGKVLSAKRMTEHEYLDYQIQMNVEIENYEECARLLKIKNETPYSEEKTRIISETF